SPTMPRVSPLYTARSTPSTAFTEFTVRRRTPPRIGKYFFRPSASRRISGRRPPPVLVARDEVPWARLEHRRLYLGEERQRHRIPVHRHGLHGLERAVPSLALAEDLRHPFAGRRSVPVRPEAAVPPVRVRRPPA